jgi:hypothetical protein
MAPYSTYQLLVMALVVSSNYALPEVTVSLFFSEKEAHTFTIIHEMVK